MLQRHIRQKQLNKSSSIFNESRDSEIEDYISLHESSLRKSRHEMKKCPEIAMSTSPQKISPEVFILANYFEFCTRMDSIDMHVIFLYEFKLDNNAAMTTHKPGIWEGHCKRKKSSALSLMEVNPSITTKQSAQDK
uniref:Uncharacterized protein n=1 Tax=Vespula pensylvanica TaxID=30213 RepID=A0A834N813_VESPE|nr:hypothetical protein H0235_015982 [Vespula pensylvanica]